MLVTFCKRSHILCGLTAFASVVLLGSCADAQERKTEAKPATQSIKQAPEKKFEDFDPKNFTNHTNITNEWLPMKSGTRWVFEGTTVEDDGTLVPHRVVINVTDLTKTIAGIRTVVSWDLDYSY